MTTAAATPSTAVALVLACPDCDGQMVLVARGPEAPAYYCECGWWEEA